MLQLHHNGAMRDFTVIKRKKVLIDAENVFSLSLQQGNLSSVAFRFNVYFTTFFPPSFECTPNTMHLLKCKVLKLHAENFLYNVFAQINMNIKTELILLKTQT